MENIKYTGLAGPFKVIAHPNRKIFNLEVSEVYCSPYWVAFVRAEDEKERIATAQLFAAAPLLLSALIKFVQVSTGCDGSFHASPALLKDCYNDGLAAIQAAISQPENVKP